MQAEDARVCIFVAAEPYQRAERKCTVEVTFRLQPIRAQLPEQIILCFMFR